MGIALSAKRGDIPKSELKGASKEMVKMSEKNLKDFASTKHKGLPEKKETKETVKNLEESIMKLIESNLHPTTTKEELLRVIKGHKR
jgi:intergrase/recombinase